MALNLSDKMPKTHSVVGNKDYHTLLDDDYEKNKSNVAHDAASLKENRGCGNWALGCDTQCLHKVAP